MALRPILAAALLIAGCGEASPPPAACVPGPTLRCTADRAMAEIVGLDIDARRRTALALQFEEMALVGEALAKLGDRSALDRLATIARAAPKGTGYIELGTSRVLFAAGFRDEAAAIARRWAAEEERLIVEGGGELRPGSLESPAATLANVGLGAEAVAMIARIRAAVEPRLAALTDADLTAYRTALVAAYARAGDARAAAMALPEALAALRRLRTASWPHDTAHYALAETVMNAGQPALADATIRAFRALATEARAWDGLDADRRAGLLRIAYRAARARGASAGAAEAAAELAALRVTLFRTDVGEAAGIAAADLLAAIEAGDGETARRLRAEALAAIERLDPKTVPETVHDRVATMHAALGDEPAYTAALARIRDDPSDWKLPNLVAQKCVILATHGHTEAALRRAARLRDSRPFAETRRMKVYGTIAASMARR